MTRYGCPRDGGKEGVTQLRNNPWRLSLRDEHAGLRGDSLAHEDRDLAGRRSRAV